MQAHCRGSSAPSAHERFWACGAKEGDEELRQYIRWGLDWLEAKQDPATGLFGGEESELVPTLNGLMNGSQDEARPVKSRSELPTSPDAVNCTRSIQDHQQ